MMLRRNSKHCRNIRNSNLLLHDSSAGVMGSVQPKLMIADLYIQ